MNISYPFSESANKMKSSKIRELMKYASMPGVISFSGGMPDPGEFPFEDVKSIINNWDSNKIVSAMQYGSTGGYQPLIEILKKRMNERYKINVSNDDLIVTTGGQQAIYLITRIFVDTDDVVIVEEPSFIGAIAAYLSHGAKLESAPLEDDGVNIKYLEDLIKRIQDKGKKIKFFYTIPNFQNPAGVSMSIKKRRALYELSLKYNLIVIEDDPYSELYFTDSIEDYIPIKSIGSQAPIVYIGSFSKILCPGFRLGWILGNNDIIDKLGLAKQSVDACSSSFGQVVAYDYLNSNRIDKYLDKMRVIYKKKKDFMISRIKEFLPEEVKSTNPSGGFFIYLDLPDGLKADELFKKAIEQKVALVTGDPFHVNQEEGNKHIRLSYSNSSYEEIDKGIKILGDVIKSMI